MEHDGYKFIQKTGRELHGVMSKEDADRATNLLWLGSILECMDLIAE